MRLRVFDSIEELNDFLADKKKADIKIKSFLVKEETDNHGKVVYTFVERFFVYERQTRS